MAKETSEQLRIALMALGREKQFSGQLCWCNTIDGGYCVGQPECHAAQAALKAIEKEQAEETPEVRSGVWRHYAGKYYLVDGVGRHTENGEMLVSYVPLYVHPAGGPPKQFRPLSMWFEKVNGVQRFTFVGNELPKGIENAE